MSKLIEVNVDGLIGPTHHFGGLGAGNIASQNSRWQTSSPRRAALEGLAKMRLVAELGVPQFFMPPIVRPNWAWLESLGYIAGRSDVLKQCWDVSPRILSAAYSSSYMWTANAATVAPCSDTSDGNLHIAIANLCSSLHRGMEALERHTQIGHWLADLENTQVHAPLPALSPLRDEGAANHMRLCNPEDTRRAMHIFVHEPFDETNLPHRFNSRQSRLGSIQISQLLRLPREHCVFVSQSVDAIDAGVFHNDVIATSHENLLIVHEDAFELMEEAIQSIRECYWQCTNNELVIALVGRDRLPLEDAVQSYLFNSQIVTSSTLGRIIICPEQCRTNAATLDLLDAWTRDPHIPIDGFRFVSLAESMANGGGPACLRLRMQLTSEQLAQLSLSDRYRVTPETLEWLESWIEKSYPDSLNMDDLQRIDFAEHVTEVALGFQFCRS